MTGPTGMDTIGPPGEESIVKLASRRDGRDGALLVVSRDAKTAVDAGAVARTLQAALDDWDHVSPGLSELYGALNQGRADGAVELDPDALAAPLPRAYQFLDGACYLSHIRRNRAARGDALPDDVLDAPLVYQGISHGFLAWNEDIRLPSEDHGIDFEAEIAAVTGDVPMGIAADEAAGAIRLFVLLNDISLRALIPPELKRTFGFLQGKPASALGPIAVTPDELGDRWNGELVSGTMVCHVRGEEFGSIETGIDTPFHYGHLIAHAARTRRLEPGTLVGLGTVSNEDERAGFGCIAERRAVETARDGSPATQLLKFGDRVRIELLDGEGHSVFGCIDQCVGPASL